MKRIGSIYCRDTSKSKDRLTKLPLKDLDQNIKNDYTHRINKRWKLQLDNYQDSEQKRFNNNNNKILHESDKKEITFNQYKFQQKNTDKDDDIVVRKMEALTKIIAEISLLKNCGLKGSQEGKLMEIQDGLLDYQKKLLQNQRQNYV